MCCYSPPPTPIPRVAKQSCVFANNANWVSSAGEREILSSWQRRSGRGPSNHDNGATTDHAIGGYSRGLHHQLILVGAVTYLGGYDCARSSLSLGDHSSLSLPQEEIADNTQGSGYIFGKGK